MKCAAASEHCRNGTDIAGGNITKVQRNPFEEAPKVKPLLEEVD